MAKKEVKQAPAKAKKAAAEAKPFTGEPRLKVKRRKTKRLKKDTPMQMSTR